MTRQQKRNQARETFKKQFTEKHTWTKFKDLSMIREWCHLAYEQVNGLRKTK